MNRVHLGPIVRRGALAAGLLLAAGATSDQSCCAPPCSPGDGRSQCADLRGPPPAVHSTSELYRNREVCPFDKGILLWSNLYHEPDLRRYFPEWSLVEDSRPVVAIEGTVMAGSARLAFEDMPMNHYTHDFVFDLQPDPKPEFTNLLGGQLVADDPGAEQTLRTQIDRRVNELAQLEDQLHQTYGQNKADIIREILAWHQREDAGLEMLRRQLRELPRHVVPQDKIEIEWESGLAAENGEDLCTPDNQAGRSCGFFSRGHTCGTELWAWPSANDWVHVVGRWVWDRGHVPEKTEIHPPRLVATRRSLLDRRRVARPGTEAQQAELAQLAAQRRQLLAGHQPGRPDPVDRAELERIAAEIARLEAVVYREVLGTRVDIFASGDGGAMVNNRGLHPYVAPAPMNDRDYSFVVEPIVPPHDGARLGYLLDTHGEAHSYGADAQVIVSMGDQDRDHPHAHVVLYWKTGNKPPDATFAQTLFLYWDDGGDGVPADFAVKHLTVHVEETRVLDRLDDTDGEYRMFLDVGGHWLFVNELAQPDCKDIVSQGLGDTGGDQRFAIGREFSLLVPPGASARVHTSGWEADGTEETFGQLVDPNGSCQAVGAAFNDLVLGFGKSLEDCRDDDIGYIDSYHTGPMRAKAVGARAEWADDAVCDDKPGGPYYTLTFYVTEP